MVLGRDVFHQDGAVGAGPATGTGLSGLAKLDLPVADTGHRRVLAVLRFLGTPHP